MDQLTPRQIAWLRTELGAKPDDTELQALHAALGTVRGVAISVVRSKITKLVNTPLTVNVSGVVSVTQSENVKALERQLVRLEGMDDDPSDDPPPVEGTVSGGLPVMVSRSIPRRRRR